MHKDLKKNVYMADYGDNLLRVVKDALWENKDQNESVNIYFNGFIINFKPIIKDVEKIINCAYKIVTGLTKKEFIEKFGDLDVVSIGEKQTFPDIARAISYHNYDNGEYVSVLAYGNRITSVGVGCSSVELSQDNLEKRFPYSEEKINKLFNEQPKLEEWKQRGKDLLKNKVYLHKKWDEWIESKIINESNPEKLIQTIFNVINECNSNKPNFSKILTMIQKFDQNEFKSFLGCLARFFKNEYNFVLPAFVSSDDYERMSL